MLEMTQLGAVARLFEVLSDANRLAILQILNERPHAVGELVDRLRLSQPMVSKHLAVLFETGLLSRERRRTHIIYSIRETMVFRLCDLVCEKLRNDAQQQVRLFGTSA